MRGGIYTGNEEYAIFPICSRNGVIDGNHVEATDDAAIYVGNSRNVVVGLVDRVQVTLFPVITGQNGSDAIFQGAADFDLERIESRTLDGNIQELTYRPTLHVHV